MEKLIDLITDLIQKKFYGSLTIKFEGGHIIVLKKEESIKLS